MHVFKGETKKFGQKILGTKRPDRKNGPDKTRNKNEDLPPNGAAFTVKIMRSDRSP